MIKLLINNTITKIEGENSQLVAIGNQLYKLLSYEKPGARFSRAPEWLKYVRLYSKIDHTFPTGLIQKVVDFLKLNGQEFELIDLRAPQEDEKSFYFNRLKKSLPLRPYQEEAMAALAKHPRGVIEAATGTGKSLLIEELIHRKGLRTLLITPSSNILNIFEEKLIAMFGRRYVGLITGNKKNLDKPITISTYQSLPKIPKEWFGNLQMIITDEAHHSAANTLYDLNINCFKNVYYRYGFSATFFRNDSSQLSLQGVLSDVIYEYKYKQAIKDGYLCPVRFVVFDNNNENYDENWRTEIRNGLTLNDEFNEKIGALARGFDKRSIPTLIFVNEIEHGNRIQALIPGSRFISGKELRADNKRDLADFNNRKFNILIGTSVIGEGVDTVPAQVGILASGFKAESEVVQKIGRLLRMSPGKTHSTFIDFMNIGCKYLSRHCKKRIQIYKSYGDDITHKLL